MSRIHLRSSSVVLWLSLSAALAASALSIGCSSDSDSGGSGGATSAGSSGNAGESSGGSGDDAGAAGSAETGGSETGGTGGQIGAAGDTNEAGAAGGEAVDPNAEAIAHALEVIGALKPDEQCPVCHQANYSGRGFWPNITPDETNGIGLWSDQEITAAILNGKDRDGGNLCATMPRFTFTESEMTDLLIYLKSIPKNAKEITGACPN